MNMITKRNIFEEKKADYFRAEKKAKGSIIKAVVAVTGLCRKSVIRRFRRLQFKDPLKEEGARGRPRYYTKEVVDALSDVWRIGSEPCGENLHPQINEYISGAIKAHAWKHSDEVTGKLRAMSEGTVKVYVGSFSRTRRSFGGRGTTKPSSIISMVPIRMDGWDKAETGVTQIDTVAHCGETTAGDFVYTVNGADVATLWGSRRAQWQKGQEATKNSLDSMRISSPFSWTEMHPDSGSEFLNHTLLRYADENRLRMTRSRPYHKNDNMLVEERNGHVIRSFVGYARFDHPDFVAALNSLYDVLTPYLNHFVASRRIIKKERIGARWKITREKISKTPFQRVLERSDVSEEVKTRLRQEHELLNVVELKKLIDERTKILLELQRKHGKPRKLKN
jgi:hypothetical protein